MLVCIYTILTSSNLWICELLFLHPFMKFYHQCYHMPPTHTPFHLRNPLAIYKWSLGFKFCFSLLLLFVFFFITFFFSPCFSTIVSALIVLCRHHIHFLCYTLSSDKTSSFWRKRFQIWSDIYFCQKNQLSTM